MMFEAGIPAEMRPAAMALTTAGCVPLTAPPTADTFIPTRSVGFTSEPHAAEGLDFPVAVQTRLSTMRRTTTGFGVRLWERDEVSME